MLKIFLVCSVLLLFRSTNTLDVGNKSDECLCGFPTTNCSLEEDMKIINEMFKRKLQDRICGIRHVLNTQLFTFKDFFGRTLRNSHLDLDSMFSNTYGNFYQENVKILNDLFERIRSFSLSYSEASMKSIIDTFFDELFLVVFKITNPFQTVTEKKLACMKDYAREIEVFGEYPLRIINQLSSPLTNWRHFLAAIETLHNILDGYLNITLKEECQRGLTRMDGCAKCSDVYEKPCMSYCINILSGCTFQMLESEEVWRSAADLLIKLATRLNNYQNLVSAIQPVPILISEAVMHFQEKSDYITNKMISRCLYTNVNENSYRFKRSIAKPYPPSRKTIDHRILNQMLSSFINKMEGYDSLFANVPQSVCDAQEWGTRDRHQCWNGTSVGMYRLALVNTSNHFMNPEYQNKNILSFRGNYIDERMRMKWLQSRLQNIISTKSEVYSERSEHTSSDDEDYGDYDNEGSADYHIHPLKSQVVRDVEKNQIEVIIEPYPVKMTSNSKWSCYMEDENDDNLLLRTFHELEFEEEEKEDKSKSSEDFSQPRASFYKELLVITASSCFVMLVFYSLFSILGLYGGSRNLIQAKAAVKPFFPEIHRGFIDDHYDGTIRYSKKHQTTVQMFYSPYSINSKHFRRKYFDVAKSMRMKHPRTFPYFSAVNCFDTGGMCRQKYKIQKYPILMSTSYQKHNSVFNGPLDEKHVIRWLNRLQNSVHRISIAEDLLHLAKQYDLMVILYVRFAPEVSQVFQNFTSASFQYYDGNPNTESTIFCVVTDPIIAKSYQIFGENSIVFVNSELNILITYGSKEWNIDDLLANVRLYSSVVRKKSIEVLNPGWQSLASSQFAEGINSSSVLLYLAENSLYNGKVYNMYREIAREYFHCKEKNIQELPVETMENETEDCSTDVKSFSCDRNSTLKFIIADTLSNPQLAAKFGVETDMIVAINGEQEVTKFVRGNVTKETINCLIKQHHEAADNQFIVESSSVIPTISQMEIKETSNPVGELSHLKFVDDINKVIGPEKNTVALFTSGIWHSSSASTLAVFHQTAEFFKNASKLIDFVIVDVTKINVPYNFNFDRLPRIIVCAAKKLGTSWSYPVELPISYPNLVKFITSRHSVELRILPILVSCDYGCRKRSLWKLRLERTRLKRSMRRHLSTNPRKRVQLGYLNRVLKLLA